VHIFLILVGYTALLLSAVAALLYLLQERRLKRRGAAGQGRVERLLSGGRVLPLETLDGWISSAMSAGFVAVTLGVVAGSTWASIEYGTRWIGQPKIIVSLLTWAFYLVMLFLRLSAGWRGRRAAVLSLVALGCSALTWAAHVGLQPLLAK
jgi:ABC-type transport system involved in cytochrome c biogenesis permease subunit